MQIFLMHSSVVSHPGVVELGNAESFLDEEQVVEAGSGLQLTVGAPSEEEVPSFSEGGLQLKVNVLLLQPLDLGLPAEKVYR